MKKVLTVTFDSCKPLPVGWTDAEKLLGNYPDTADTLRPYECVVLKK